jgi:hypothetical protein
MACPECFYWTWLPDAGLVQLISFPFLLLGLVLVLLELRYPGLIARAERWVRASGQRLRNTDVHDALVGFRHREWTREARVGALFLLFLTGLFQALYFIIMIDSVLAFAGTWVVLTAIGLLGLRFGRSRDQIVRMACLSIVMGTCVQILAAYAVAHALSRMGMRVLGFFDRTGGRAIGRIGLTLGSVGLFGEAYQLLRISSLDYWTVIVLAPVALIAVVFFISGLMKRAEATTAPVIANGGAMVVDEDDEQGA